MSTASAEPEVKVRNLFKGANHAGEYLLTVYTDGSHEISFRTYTWDTWGRPVKLTAVPTC